MVIRNHVSEEGAIPVERYFDLHPTEEELMGESERHARLIHYLVELLRWYYREVGWYITQNMNVYQTLQPHEEPLTPDVAVFVGLALPDDAERNLRSWTVHPPEYPAPAVVFEIASDTTWQRDVRDKPEEYGRLGVREYIYYDPRPAGQVRGQRLRGWRYSAGQPQELERDAQDRLWSEALASWLVADGAFLRLTDTAGQRRLTEAEAERAAKETERFRAERLAARLRELGIDPEAVD